MSTGHSRLARRSTWAPARTSIRATSPSGEVNSVASAAGSNTTRTSSASGIARPDHLDEAGFHVVEAEAAPVPHPHDLRTSRRSARRAPGRSGEVAGIAVEAVGDDRLVPADPGVGTGRRADVGPDPGGDRRGPRSPRRGLLRPRGAAPRSSSSRPGYSRPQPRAPQPPGPFADAGQVGVEPRRAAARRSCRR